MGHAAALNGAHGRGPVSRKRAADRRACCDCFSTCLFCRRCWSTDLWSAEVGQRPARRGRQAGAVARPAEARTATFRARPAGACLNRFEFEVEIDVVAGGVAVFGTH